MSLQDKPKQPLALFSGSTFAKLASGCHFRATQDTPKPLSTTNIINTIEGTFDVKAAKDDRIRVYGEDVPRPLDDASQVFCDKQIPERIRANILQHLGTKNFNDESGKVVLATPVQRAALPVLLGDPERDALVVGPTGTGKTLMYIVGTTSALEDPKESNDNNIKVVKASVLVLAPTAELAAQIEREFGKFTEGDPVISSKFLVSTPLTLLRRLRDKSVDKSVIAQVVLDEADKLLSEDHLHQVDAILNELLSVEIGKKQGARPRLILCSATIPSGIEALARTFLRPDAVRVEVGAPMGSLSSIRQELVFVGSDAGKGMACKALFAKRDGSMTPPVLIFVRTCERAVAVAQELTQSGIPHVSTLHSKQPLGDRQKTLAAFSSFSQKTKKEKVCWFLVTTDVLARGLDLPAITTVLSWDFPSDTATYIHRIGRTGRAGLPGHAITFYTLADQGRLGIVVNVMKQSGIVVPEWMSAIKDNRKRIKKEVKAGLSEAKRQEEATRRVLSAGKKPRRHRIRKSGIAKKRNQ